MIEWILILMFVGQPDYKISMKLDTRVSCLRVGKAIYLTSTDILTPKHTWNVPPYRCEKVTN